MYPVGAPQIQNVVNKIRTVIGDRWYTTSDYKGQTITFHNTSGLVFVYPLTALQYTGATTDATENYPAEHYALRRANFQDKWTTLGRLMRLAVAQGRTGRQSIVASVETCEYTGEHSVNYRLSARSE